MQFKISIFCLLIRIKKHFYCVILPRKEEGCTTATTTTTTTECVWVGVWPVSLASSPAPHVTHSLGPNVDQNRKKHIKGCFFFYYTNTTKKKVDFNATGILPSLSWQRKTTTAQMPPKMNGRTPVVIVSHGVTAYVMMFISPSPLPADTCEHTPSVRVDFYFMHYPETKGT